MAVGYNLYCFILKFNMMCINHFQDIFQFQIMQNVRFTEKKPTYTYDYKITRHLIMRQHTTLKKVTIAKRI